MMQLILLIAVLCLCVVCSASSVKFIKGTERLAVFRLGRCLGVRGPGLVFIAPFLDKGIKVELSSIQGWKDISAEALVEAVKQQALGTSLKTADDEHLIPVFMPALSALLIHAEDEKGAPLTIEDARASLDRFYSLLPTDGSPRPEALIKIALARGADEINVWLANTSTSGPLFAAEFFEIPNGLSGRQIGDRLEVPADSVLDWMINDNEVLYGGFSLRYRRSKLPEAERQSYDEYIGVHEYD